MVGVEEDELELAQVRRRLGDAHLGLEDPGRPILVGCPMWLPVVAAAMVTFVVLRRCRNSTRPGICTCCGYDLTGNVSGICPECGTAIPEKHRAEPVGLVIEGNSVVASSGPHPALRDGMGHPDSHDGLALRER